MALKLKLKYAVFETTATKQNFSFLTGFIVTDLDVKFF